MACKCYHADRNFLGKVGICWGTKECEPCSCGGDETKCNFYDHVRERAKKVVTNADRIRVMTDEEIENWYWWMRREMMYYTDSYAFVHEWLKQEVGNEAD